MTADMFANRDTFVAKFAEVFKNAGWKADFHKGETYWGFLWSRPNFRVTTSFSAGAVQQRRETPVVSFAAGLSKAELDAISEELFPTPQGYDASPVIIASYRVKEAIPNDLEDHPRFIRSLSEKIIQWASIQDIEACIRNFATPWETEKQLTHLAALAYFGDFITLMEYQEMFKRGKRANFYPMIEAEMIDRAVNIAIERAF
ncbi:hypothetical protein HR059_02285 [Sinorhizobium meliloti WSM1022]|jgi:hypothetical protein|uniref:DUF6990 domain-containing protein n=1 Tax=Rhizobium meliloti TaxID=382 RepID=UPI00067F292E|nr:hypothetical protein [Sinorhizobium meliloti]ASQ04975.1 hypothetical protein CDO23_14120 [Sinorhizobium meliloti]MCO6421844.1 hypothetical protein [Sinorhizobium meliloti]MDW9412395.1 hypothetical protein [Sinorhizobium meliloti]MDW9440130.1 hypothetical protein [Sinorhizobium meliloti]MDW9457857.1 hypothetical protein [Sinorhizobium meliloti]